MLRKVIIILFVLIGVLLSTVSGAVSVEAEDIKLPRLYRNDHISIEKALLLKRSAREYSDRPLAFNEISQLLRTRQGITSPSGFRKAPPAEAIYPLAVTIEQPLSIMPGVKK